MPSHHKGHPTIAFRPSEWARALIDQRAALSGLYKKGNYSVLLRNPQFLHKVEKRKRAEKNQRNVNIQEAKKVVC